MRFYGGIIPNYQVSLNNCNDIETVVEWREMLINDLKGLRLQGEPNP